MSIGCRSVEYSPGVDRVSVGRVLAESRYGVGRYSFGRVSIGCRSVEYQPSVSRVSVVQFWPSVDTVSVGRVSAECR